MAYGLAVSSLVALLEKHNKKIMIIGLRDILLSECPNVSKMKFNFLNLFLG
jgi:hypothetical protein